MSPSPEPRGRSLNPIARLPRPGLLPVLAVLLLLVLATQRTTSQTATPISAEPGAIPAQQWAAAAARNEIEVIQYHRPLLRYREHVVNSKGDEMRDVIESTDGAVARILYRDGRLITPEEDTAERQRLQEMLDSPGAFAKHMKNDQNGKKLAADLLNQFPAAMVYTYTPGQPQRPRPPVKGELPEVVLDFAPNPKWTPPSLASEALTGLRGRLWIDARTKHITRMEAEIFQQVNFGWGFFAHVYPGGKLMLEQVSVDDQRWIFSRFTESVVVRAVLVKTIRENSDVQASNFAVVPPMSYQDAIHALLNTPLPAH